MNDYSYPPSRVGPIVMGLGQPKRVADWGCNRGNWLSWFKEQHSCEVQGFDCIDYDDRFLLGENEFQKVDFESEIPVSHCDLAISLENAEHISQSRADALIHSLTSSSDFILFSAATPGQGGNGHINEQPHSYWHYKFACKGYVLYDQIRWAIREDSRIPFA